MQYTVKDVSSKQNPMQSVEDMHLLILIFLCDIEISQVLILTSEGLSWGQVFGSVIGMGHTM